MLELLTPADLTPVQLAISDLEARVTALETGGTLIFDGEADMSPQVGIAISGEYDHLELVCSYVTADVQPGSVLTVYLTDVPGAGSFDTGPNYNNQGLSNWRGEPNPSYTQPWCISEPQLLSIGCRIGIDVGERVDLGIHSRVHFTAMGMVSGNAVSPTYIAQGYAGFIGGAAGVSDKPAHLGGGKWFPGDPVGTPFDWAAQFSYAGHWKSPGSRVTGMLINMNGGGTFGRKIKTGRFQLWGR